MNVDRKAFINHLQHIYTDTLLPDAVVRGQFSAFGSSLNKQVFVVAGPFEKADPIPNEIGITNLKMLISILSDIEDDSVGLTVEERAVVVTATDKLFRLVTSSSRVISTMVDESIKTKVLALIPDTAQWHPLEHRTVNGIIGAVRIIGAEGVRLEVRFGGSTMVVGDPRLNAAEFVLSDFKSPDSHGYDILLSSEILVPVLKQLADFTKAEMALTGPDSVVAIREGPYTYVLSPDKAEAKKA